MSFENKQPIYISYAWPILAASVPNAVAFALALKILSSASTTFETTVFALLILIYSDVSWMMASRGALATEQALLGARRHLRLLELLRDPSYAGESKEMFEELLREQEHTVGKGRVLLVLQSIWAIALTAITLYYLLRNLF
jgi:hypothetical protein